MHAQINKIVPGVCVCVWGLSVCQWGGGLILVILLWELNKCEFTEGGGGEKGDLWISRSVYELFHNGIFSESHDMQNCQQFSKGVDVDINLPFIQVILYKTQRLAF